MSFSLNFEGMLEIVASKGLGMSFSINTPGSNIYSKVLLYESRCLFGVTEVKIRIK